MRRDQSAPCSSTAFPGPSLAEMDHWAKGSAGGRGRNDHVAYAQSDLSGAIRPDVIQTVFLKNGAKYLRQVKGRCHVLARAKGREKLLKKLAACRQKGTDHDNFTPESGPPAH